MWASLMFLYIYNDYFNLYSPSVIEAMQAGRMGPLGPASDAVMTGVSVLLAVPALMICGSAALGPVASRWANIVLGAAYTAIEAAARWPRGAQPRP